MQKNGQKSWFFEKSLPMFPEGFIDFGKIALEN